MKRLFLLVTACALFSVSCDRVDPGVDLNDCIEVRMLAEICGNAALQVVDPKLQHLLGTDWENQEGTHSGVFHAQLPCDIDPGVYEEGITFFVKLLDEPNPNVMDCVRCLAAFANPPEVEYYVDVMLQCEGVER